MKRCGKIVLGFIMKIKRKHYKIRRTVFGAFLLFQGKKVKTYQLNLSNYLFNGVPIMIDECNLHKLKRHEVAFIKLKMSIEKH